MNDDAFTINELDSAIRMQKNDKSPGSDACRAELVKLLDLTNQTALLELYNDILAHRDISRVLQACEHCSPLQRR